MLEWNVRTAYQAGLAGKLDDTVLLKYARHYNRIYLTFDELRGEQGERIGRELRRGGGDILQMHCNSGQDKYRIIGKLLFHYPDWYPFLTTTSGISVLSDPQNNCKNYTPDFWHQKYHRLDAEQFTAYLKQRSLKQIKPLARHLKKNPPEQQLLT